MSTSKVITGIVSSPSFDSIILIAIILNSIAIACTDYSVVDDNYQPSTELSVRNSIIEKIDVPFTVIFTVECLLKVIAFGFWKRRNAYLRDGCNVLDLLIVVTR